MFRVMSFQNLTKLIQHNIGLGSAVVITMYKLGFPEARAAYVAEHGPQIHAMPAEGKYIEKKKKTA